MLFAQGNTTTSSPRDSESWRTYSEAMYSGALDDQTIKEIIEWHQTHGSCGKQPCHDWNETDSNRPMLNGSMLKAGVPSGSGVYQKFHRIFNSANFAQILEQRQETNQSRNDRG